MRKLDLEVLGLVLNKKINSYTFIPEYQGLTNFISITFNNELTDAINVYELAHKYKEWARKNNVIITSHPLLCDHENNHTFTAITHISNSADNSYDISKVTEKTEIEAIFKASEQVYFERLKDKLNENK